MKNRKLLLIVSLVLALTMSLGGTLAYLQDTDEAVNVMTLGNVKIEQLENGQNENGFVNGQPLYPAHYTAENYEQATDVVGNLAKKVTVKNVGNSDAYVRTVIAIEQGDLTDDEFKQYIHTKFETEPTWVDGIVEIAGTKYRIACVTYPEKLAAKTESAASLLEVAMDKYATNEIVAKLGDTYEILVVTQACQTINMPEKADEALNIVFGTLSKDSHPWSDWNGTSDDQNPGNIIASKADLLALSGKSVEGTYTLMANIDMEGADFQAMSAKGNVVLNGNGYYISNINFVPATHSGMHTIGMFHMANEGSSPESLTIKNLTVKNATNTPASSEYSDAAVIVGYNTIGKSEIILDNVDVVKASINNPHGNAALLVGYSTGKVTLIDCDVTGTAVGEEDNKQGAYIGTANTADCVVTITNCTNGTDLNDIGRKVYGATASGETAKVADQSGLASAIADGQAVVLTGDVTFAVDIANDANINLAGNTFVATNTIVLTNNADLTMTGGDYEVNGTYGHVDVRPSTAEGSTVVFENVDFSYNKLGPTYGPSTNRLGSVVEVCATVADANTNIIFKNCTFDNAQVVFEGMSGKTGTFEATFENCTFNALTSSAPIYVQNYVTGNITVKDCTFHLVATSSTASAISISPSSSTDVTLNLEGTNIINATAATPSGEDGSVEQIKVNGTPANIKFVSSYDNTTVKNEGTVTATGIAAAFNAAN